MTVPEIDEKFDEKAHAAHIESAAGHDEWSHIRSDAIIAEDKERAMGVIEGLKTYPAAVFWSFCISCCIIMEGYDTAVLGNVIGLPQFRQKFGTFIDEENGYQLSAAWQTAIGQAPNIGCLFGITLASYCQDRWGYKRTLQAGLVFLVGCIFIVFFAPTIEVLFAGEFLCGLPWGAFSSSAVSYASDVTPVALRGYLTTYVNLCWIIGQILAAGILYRVLDIQSEWAYKIAFAIQWVWPIPLFIAITLAPESPWFLVRKGRLEDAKRVVQRLAKKGDTVDPAQTVAMMVRTNQLEIDNNTQGSFADCFRRSDRRRTEIACLGWLCQVLCGMVFAGSPVYFLQQAGMGENNSFQVNLGITFMAFAGTCLSWIALTFGGRRPFFIGGMIVMGVIIYVIGGLGFAADHNQNIRWGQAALIMIFVFTYDFTVGPLAYCVVGETSATRLRAKSVGLARMTYNLGNIVCGILNTYMVNPTAWNLKSRSALLWAGTNTVMTVWCYFRLPEMRGRTYRELDILFEREVPARDFKKTVVTDEDDA